MPPVVVPPPAAVLAGGACRGMRRASRGRRRVRASRRPRPCIPRCGWATSSAATPTRPCPAALPRSTRNCRAAAGRAGCSASCCCRTPASARSACSARRLAAVQQAGRLRDAVRPAAAACRAGRLAQLRARRGAAAGRSHTRCKVRGRQRQPVGARAGAQERPCGRGARLAAAAPARRAAAPPAARRAGPRRPGVRVARDGRAAAAHRRAAAAGVARRRRRHAAAAPAQAPRPAAGAPLQLALPPVLSARGPQPGRKPRRRPQRGRPRCMRPPSSTWRRDRL